MENTKFYQLDGEQKLQAISQMFCFKQQNNWPNGAIWESEDDLIADLDQGYNPDDHFTFRIDEFSEVDTKIG